MTDDSSFRKALLKIVQEDFDGDAVEVISYKDGGYKSIPASYCGEGTCWDDEWVTEVTYLDKHGNEWTDDIVEHLPLLLDRLST